MRTLDAIQSEVGEWAQVNFGDNESPFFVLKIEAFPVDWKPGSPMPNTLVALESLAPLMGIAEEIGELAAATKKEDIEDALGDMFIYLCDFACRLDFILPFGRHLKYEIDAGGDSFKGMVEWTGRLFHGTLKRHQGIRGFGADDVYFDHCVKCTAMLLAYMQAHSKALGVDLTIIANTTWNNVVSKRDWKKAPIDGGGFTHDDGDVE